MATIKGQNLRIFLNNLVLAGARECDLSIRVEMQDISTKDDTGSFTTQQVARLSWELRSSGVVTPDSDRNDVADLMDYIGDEVGVEFGVAGGTQNSTLTDSLLAGRAIVTDVQVTANNRELSIYSVVLTGQRDILFPLATLVSYDSLRFVTSDSKIVCVVNDAS